MRGIGLRVRSEYLRPKHVGMGLCLPATNDVRPNPNCNKTVRWGFQAEVPDAVTLCRIWSWRSELNRGPAHYEQGSAQRASSLGAR